MYKNLIEAAPIGYIYCKIVLNENGEPCDYLFEDVNNAFADMMRMKAEDIIGKLRTEVAGAVNEDIAGWVRKCADIALHGGSGEDEYYNETLERYFKTFLYSSKQGYFTGLISDVTQYKKDEQQKTLMLMALNDIIFEVDENFVYINVYTSDESQLFVPKDQLIGKHMRGLVDLELDERLINTLKRAKESGAREFAVYQSVAPGNNNWYQADVRYREIGGENRYILRVTDVTEQKNREIELKISEEKYRLITENISDVIWILNLNQKKFTYISPSVLQLRGFTAEEAMGQSMEESLTPESIAIVMKTLEENLPEFVKNPDSEGSFINELQQPCKDGSVIWVEVSTKLRYNDRDEIEVVGVSRNIENRKQSQEEVLYLSFHDQLTGLYNRRYYEEELSRINVARNLPMTLVMSDVNGLKLTNDAFGHQVGDDLLKRYAQVLKTVCRKDDIIARIGGDEFVILLPNTDSYQAQGLVERIQKEISGQKVSMVGLSVSFGWQTKVKEEEHFERIFKQAEDNMYQRKVMDGKSYKGATVKLILQSLHEKDAEERFHAERVSSLCKEIGEAMELGFEDVGKLTLAGLFHDIGKIGLDDALLNKKEELTKSEWRQLKRHSEIGYQILRSVDDFSGIADIVLYHHERLDGTGYPNGLRGDQIPMMAKIVAVADAYDSIFRNQPSRSMKDAVRELRLGTGTQYDETITKTFVEKVLKVQWNSQPEVGDKNGEK